MHTALRRVKRQYQGAEERPLGGYLAVLGVYGGVTGGLAVVARALRISPPTPGITDTVLLSVATHKLSRLLSKDAVTSPLRAPFTKVRGADG